MDLLSSKKIVSQRSTKAVVLVLVTFLAISIITGVMGPIFPSLKGDFQINNTIAACFAFAFFIAYGVMSIPAGLLTEKFGARKVMVLAFAVAALGSLSFASYPSLSVALLSLFCIGSAMALLQVVINPLLRVSGGEENYAFYSMLGQLIFAVGGMLAPQIYSSLVQSLQQSEPSAAIVALAEVVPASMPWVSMYWVFLIICVLLLAAVFCIRLPAVALNDDEKVGGLALCFKLFGNKTVLLFFFGIMAYVGAEVGITTSMSSFLQTYHGLDPVTAGADAISAFWQAMAVGCVVGLGLMKLLDSRKVLLMFSAAAIASYLVALFASTVLSLWAYTATGFFLSVMYPAIFSLGLNSLRQHHGSAAGIFCTGIAGGALVPLIIGIVADVSGDYRTGALLVIFPLSYVLSIGLWAKPIVANKTVPLGAKHFAVLKSALLPQRESIK